MGVVAPVAKKASAAASSSATTENEETGSETDDTTPTKTAAAGTKRGRASKRKQQIAEDWGLEEDAAKSPTGKESTEELPAPPPAKKVGTCSANAVSFGLLSADWQIVLLVRPVDKPHCPKFGPRHNLTILRLRQHGLVSESTEEHRWQS